MNTEILRFKALKSLVPNCEYSWRGNEYSGLEWRGPGEKPTEVEIDTERDRLQAEFDALQYQRDRENEYPSIQDLVVALYDTDDKSAIEAKRAAVKLKYPKP